MHSTKSQEAELRNLCSVVEILSYVIFVKVALMLSTAV